jgi:hypothetical protein
MKCWTFYLRLDKPSNELSKSIRKRRHPTIACVMNGEGNTMQEEVQLVKGQKKAYHYGE